MLCHLYRSAIRFNFLFWFVLKKQQQQQTPAKSTATTNETIVKVFFLCVAVRDLRHETGSIWLTENQT